MIESKPEKRLVVFIDPGVFDALRDAALKNNRTLSGELRGTLRKLYVEGARLVPAGAAE